MSLSWSGVVLLILLVACTEEPCRGNETNDQVAEKQIVKYPGGNLNWSRVLNLVDPARLAIFVICLLLIIHASQKAVKLDKENRDDINKEGVHELTCYHAILFPVVGSIMLLVFFYFFEFIQYIYTIVTAVISTIALFNLVLPAIQWMEICFKERQLLSSRKLFHPVLISIALSIAIATAWILTGHWICLDLLGAAICVFMIQFIRVPSLKISTLLLVGLLIYDVFWVFYSSSIFKTNVMVEVATKKAENPVAAVAQRLNLPKAVQSSPPLSIPGKLMVPRAAPVLLLVLIRPNSTCYRLCYYWPYSYNFSDGRVFAMLGLGDIVLPGLLLCFAMRVDNENSISSGVGGARGGVLPHPLLGKATRCLLCCRQWSYFTVALLGYASGLLVASFVADWYRAAQPALLYLVPGVLLPMIIKALLQGDLKALWNGPFSSLSSNQTSLPPTRTTEKHSYHQVGKYLLPV